MNSVAIFSGLWISPYLRVGQVPEPGLTSTVWLAGGTPVSCLLSCSWRPCLAAKRFCPGAWESILRGGHWPVPGIRSSHTEPFFLFSAQTTHRSGRSTWTRPV
ncbi:hypothetical protein PoB_004678300 [Plakobranchus ocellatus]|uniref:Secreted protein n=1 Tax=Plakobranchus ocellatus TaxID=259542 RepID=A0AAV4BNA4_9GAST|nr:hypothetical protein PoB_004678300 [Plakobranchus ocellatus]